MRRSFILQRVVTALLSVVAGMVFVLVLERTASAETYCWINAKTGEPYPPSRLAPLGADPINFLVDPNHVEIRPGPDVPGGGKYAGTWVRGSDGTWINAKTGEPYPPSRLAPLGADPINFLVDPNHVEIRPGPDVPGGGKYAGTWVRVPCAPQQTAASTGLYLGGGYAWNTSTTTITSMTDRQRIKQDPSQAMLTARANFGPWFLTGQVQFAGAPGGSFSDVFFATPGLNTTATINSGNVYGFNGDAGYTVWNGGGWAVGIFGGYYSFNEELYGVFPGFAGTFNLLSDHWRAGEGGVSVDKAFTVGTEPFNLNVTVAGLYDNLRAGAFNGNGGGVRANGTLSFPLGPVNGNIYVQYANLNASGSNTGVPLTFKDEVWTVGFGVTYKFGGPAASAAAPGYPVKALPAK